MDMVLDVHFPIRLHALILLLRCSNSIGYGIITKCDTRSHYCIHCYAINSASRGAAVKWGSRGGGGAEVVLREGVGVIFIVVL